MKIEFSSQRREILLFLTTNMTAVTLRANQLLMVKNTGIIIIIIIIMVIIIIIIIIIITV